MKIFLEQIVRKLGDEVGFMVYYSEAGKRTLIPYPQVTELRFSDNSARPIEWKTSVLDHSPFDILVLNPLDIISFTLILRMTSRGLQFGNWNLDVPFNEKLFLAYELSIDPEGDSVRHVYEHLTFQGSKLYGATPAKGTFVSNTISVEL